MASKKLPLSAYFANMAREAWLSPTNRFYGKTYECYVDLACAARCSEKQRDLGALMYLAEISGAPYEAHELLAEQVPTE